MTRRGIRILRRIGKPYLQKRRKLQIYEINLQNYFSS